MSCCRIRRIYLSLHHFFFSRRLQWLQLESHVVAARAAACAYIKRVAELEIVSTETQEGRHARG